jgi:hypothetical protein
VLLAPDAFRGRVAAFIRRRGPVQLVQDGIVHFAREAQFHRFKISLETVGRDLNAMGEPDREVAYERLSILAVAKANVVDPNSWTTGLVSLTGIIAT